MERRPTRDVPGTWDWDPDRVFDDTYLAFYDAVLGEDRTVAEAERVLRLLDPPPRGRLVDLCCGHGRHARRLAAGGFAIVGVDRSAGFLARAREGAPPGARFLRADVVALPLADRSADGAYCWFSSIGYRGPDSDLAMLREARRVLRPGSRLAVETRNWTTVEAGEQIVETPRGRIVDRVERDLAARRLRTRRRYEPEGAPPREVEFSLHLYDVGEFSNLLESAGFVAVRVLDGEDRPIGGAPARIAFLGRRPGGDR